jgi:hypothetical protein
MANQEPYILLGIYESLYFAKYNKKPKLNKYREKWAMQDVIDSIGFDRTKELLEYYFKTGRSSHPISFFFYNFDRLDFMKQEIDKDIQNRENLRRLTKKLVEEA